MATVTAASVGSGVKNDALLVIACTMAWATVMSAGTDAAVSAKRWSGRGLLVRGGHGSPDGARRNVSCRRVNVSCRPVKGSLREMNVSVSLMPLHA
jgi:hypothetical protein